MNKLSDEQINNALESINFNTGTHYGKLSAEILLPKFKGE